LRAVAFTLSYFLTDNKLGPIPRQRILFVLHRPWRTLVEKPLLGALDKPYTAVRTLEIISCLLTNTYPSRALLSTLISPLIAPLYALYAYLRLQRAADPTLLELCRTLFITWAKITEVEEGREVIWSIVEGQGGMWTVEEGDFQWINESVAIGCSAPQ
jgi:hypothetical protein